MGGMRLAPLGLVAVWVALTAILSTTAFLAVQIVAVEVGGTQAKILSAAAVSSAVATASPAPTPQPAKVDKPKGAKKSPSATSKPAATQKPTGNNNQPATKPSTKPTPKPSPTPKPKPSKTTQPQPSASATFAVAGGTVAASCAGSAITLKSAAPNDGWRVEVHDRGPKELEITFRSGDQETEVKIRCSNGKPVLESHDGED